MKSYGPYDKIEIQFISNKDMGIYNWNAIKVFGINDDGINKKKSNIIPGSPFNQLMFMSEKLFLNRNVGKKTVIAARLGKVKIIVTDDNECQMYRISNKDLRDF